MTKKKDDIKIINADEAESTAPDLPPPGHARDEELARRADALDQAAEEITEQREVHRFDPAQLKPILEILQHINELEVEDAQPGHRYFWCYEGQNGRMIMLAQRLGWTVVQSADPECATLKDARGYRKIGDTILMRTTEDRYQLIERSREYQRMVREQGIDSALQELGDKYAHKGFKVHSNIEDVSVGRQDKSLMDIMSNKAKQQGARRTAAKHVDGMLRAGTVPGMPSPGKGGR